MLKLLESGHVEEGKKKEKKEANYQNPVEVTENYGG